MGIWAGRYFVLAAVILFGVVLAVAYLHSKEWSAAWQLLYVPAMDRSFADTRTITYSIDCLAIGGDPYLSRDCDPWSRLYNYPEPWLWLRYLGVSSASTNAIGIGIALAFFSTVVALFRLHSLTTGLIAALAVLSPPVLLGVERGNTDLLIFVALTATIYLTSELPIERRQIANGCAIVPLAVLKLFPIAALAVVARTRNGLYFSIVFAILSFALILLTTGWDLVHVISNTPVTVIGTSYGSSRIVMVAMHDLGLRIGPSATLPRVIGLCAAIAVFLLSVNVGQRHRACLMLYMPPLQRDARSVLGLAGIAIFLGSFLLGSNFDYRLVFLLCTLPVLLRAYEQDESLKRLTVPILIVIFLWLSRISQEILFADELLDWALFSVLSAWLGQSTWPFYRNAEATLLREPMATPAHDKLAAALSLDRRSSCQMASPFAKPPTSYRVGSRPDSC